MYDIVYTGKFKKDLKRIGHRNLQDLPLVKEFVLRLSEKGTLGVPKNMQPHKLKGNYKDNWECHIKPDLLIIWFQIESPKTIRLIRVGSHSDLFK